MHLAIFSAATCLDCIHMPRPDPCLRLIRTSHMCAVQGTADGLSGWRGWLGFGLAVVAMVSAAIYFVSLQAFRHLGFNSLQLQVRRQARLTAIHCWQLAGEQRAVPDPRHLLCAAVLLLVLLHPGAAAPHAAHRWRRLERPIRWLDSQQLGCPGDGGSDMCVIQLLPTGKSQRSRFRCAICGTVHCSPCSSMIMPCGLPGRPLMCSPPPFCALPAAAARHLAAGRAHAVHVLRPAPRRLHCPVRAPAVVHCYHQRRAGEGDGEVLPRGWPAPEAGGCEWSADSQDVPCRLWESWLWWLP